MLLYRFHVTLTCSRSHFRSTSSSNICWGHSRGITLWLCYSSVTALLLST